MFQEENAVLLDWMDLLSLALQFELSHRLKSGSISEFLDSFDLKYGTVPLSTASVCYCSVLYWSRVLYTKNQKSFQTTSEWMINDHP